MTEKSKNTFPIKYDTGDFVKVIEDRSKITDRPMTNSMVKKALAKYNKEKYESISTEHVKQLLIKLQEENKISGGKDPDLGMYLWRKRE